ncbi:OB-fold domain-containing protein [Alcaligenaceae bacterium]|nr:OB-fold domain-containing protein [Alcaligenaceae bacterium]
MTTYVKPLPAVTEQSRPFWEATRERRFILPRCDHCGAYHTYFEPWCSNCGKEGVHWEQLSGRGRIWANCRFHKQYFPGFEEPYNVVMVQLEEGPRLMSNIVDTAHGTLDEMPIGMEVEIVFEDVTDEVTLVKFKPISLSQEV